MRNENLSGRSLYRNWLVWLGDPQSSRPMPARPLLEAAIGELVDQCTRHGVLSEALRKLKRLARQDPARLIASSDAERGARFARILQDGQEKLQTLVGYTEMLRAVEQELSSALHDAGIEFLILKGSTFADRIYPDPSLRQFTDIDILARPAALADIRKVLAVHGLSPVETHTQKHAGRYAEEKWLYPLLDGLLVEVHWDLVTSPRLRDVVALTYDDLVALLDADERLNVHGLLLVAAIHGAAGHGFESLQQVVDVAQAARTVTKTAGDMELTEIAAGKGWRWTLQVALLTAAYILDDPDCAHLARALDASPRAMSLPRILGAAAVLEAGGSRHSRFSWRRQLYREAFVRLSPRA